MNTFWGSSFCELMKAACTHVKKSMPCCLLLRYVMHDMLVAHKCNSLYKQI